MKRYNNSTTLVLQIVFAVLCAAVFIFLAIMLSGFLSACQGGGAANGLGAAFIIILGIIGIVVAAILAIPFILLMVFCKKPWIALPAFVVLALLAIATLIVFTTVQVGEAESFATIRLCEFGCGRMI